MRALLLLGGLVGACGQLAGTLNREGGPSVTLRECTKAKGCRPRRAGVTLDANWRWLHDAKGYKNCYTTTNEWDPTLCPNPQACAENCALEGVTSAEYKSTYGISASRGGLELKFASKTEYGTNYGSRVYLLDSWPALPPARLKGRCPSPVPPLRRDGHFLGPALPKRHKAAEPQLHRSPARLAPANNGGPCTPHALTGTASTATCK